MMHVHTHCFKNVFTHIINTANLKLGGTIYFDVSPKELETLGTFKDNKRVFIENFSACDPELRVYNFTFKTKEDGNSEVCECILNSPTDSKTFTSIDMIIDMLVKTQTENFHAECATSNKINWCKSIDDNQFILK